MEKSVDNEKELFMQIENEFSGIYNEIMDCQELSIYKSQFLKNKLEFLVDEISNYVQQINDYNSKLRKTRKIIINATFIITLISLLMIFVNPFIPAAVNLIGVLARIKINQYYLKNIKGNYIESKANDTLILLQNCVTFLERKSKNRVERLTKEFLITPTKSIDIMIANEILQEYLELDDVVDFAIVLNFMNDNIKNCLINILQEDLSVSNDNLEELLNMAREKISRESLSEELKLCRNLLKKGEK